MPVIDTHHKSNESEIERLAEKQMNRANTGGELPKIPVGTPILYDKKPDSIVFFANSFVSNAGTNTRNATFKIVHSDLLNKTWIAHQQYENVTIEVSHSSIFKNHNCISILKLEKLQKRQLGQLFCNWLKNYRKGTTSL